MIGKSKMGWRVRCHAGTQLRHLVADKEGILVRKTTNHAWPYVIKLLDSGEEVELDEEQFELLGPASPDMVQPVRQSNQPDQTGEVKQVKTATKTKAKSGRERVPLKPTAKTSERRKPAEKVAAKSRARTPLKVKAKTKANGKAVSKPTRAGWGDAILKVLNGRKNVPLPEIYKGVAKLMGDVSGFNAYPNATVRMTLQALARQGKADNPRKGVWSAMGKAKAKAPATAKA